jgi:hypothetical protein
MARVILTVFACVSKQQRRQPKQVTYKEITRVLRVAAESARMVSTAAVIMSVATPTLAI